jgi:glycosyltransferase involved in cell wall biosynthesis
MKLEIWVLVAGGFHAYGGMDQLNLAFAQHLVDTGHQIHVVAYSIAASLLRHPLVTSHVVRKPFGSFLLGSALLSSRGKHIARLVKASVPEARVLTNGGICRWNDINWAHCVHCAWPCRDDGAPLWFRIKNRFAKQLAMRTERRAFRSARVVIANSEKTRRDLCGHLGIDSKRVHTVHPGAEASWLPSTNSQRCVAKNRLGQPETRPVAVFVGALSFDNNKGFDTLWRAWQNLCKDRRWDAHLIVAGSGSGLVRWQTRVSASRWADRVTFLGFTEQVADLFAAADLLVSPVRYEAYGLNVQEAVCRGIPAIVSESAGIAELFPEEVRTMLLPDPESASMLVDRLWLWRSDIELWKSRFLVFGAALRKNGFGDMAQRLLAIAAK